MIHRNSDNIESTREASKTPVSKLPPGFPAYCIYVPTGMNPDEQTVIDELISWGNICGKNLFVAPWNIGDPSYTELLAAVGLSKKPSIILTDTHAPDARSFRITIDNPRITRDIEKLREVLPALLDLILIGKNKEAIKMYLSADRAADLRAYVSAIGTVLSHVTIGISWNGITVRP